VGFLISYRGAFEGERAVIKLCLKLAALIVDAMILDDRGDEAKPDHKLCHALTNDKPLLS
jgi:hypothetical protein